MRLPETYARRMQELLGDECEAYMESFEREYSQGLRVNTRKISPEAFLGLWGDPLESVPWCPAGFYLSPGGKPPSKHPFYFAGAYYLQEPSAVAPAAILPVEPGDRVLDLCAAPGGKSTHLAARLEGRGVLVSNDVSASRAKALLKNLELFGTENAVVTSEAPYKLASRFAGYFSKILVDAPCSGEGMFHKDPSIVKNWEQYGNEYYAKIQEEILDSAAAMLAPGGMLLYSTCTFSPLEDEQTVQNFLQRHREYQLVEIPKCGGMADGRPEWIPEGDSALRRCARFWPHRLRGEGHFAALFQKEGTALPWRDKAESAGRKRELEPFYRFVEDTLAVEAASLPGAHQMPQLLGERLYWMPVEMEALAGLRILRNGLYAGDVKGGRFEPSQAFALALKKEQVRKLAVFDTEDPMVIRYLKGETLPSQFAPGWNLVCAGPFGLGWGKASGSLLKNKYLRGWRYQ